MIAGTTLAVTPAQEASWQNLAADALIAVQEGRQQVPTVRVTTDIGAVGSIPVSDRMPVTFEDSDAPERFLGNVVHLGPEPEPEAPVLAH
jgi:hypothetical protein